MAGRTYVLDALTEALGDGWDVTSAERQPQGPTAYVYMESRSRTTGLQMVDAVKVVVFGPWQLSGEQITPNQSVLDLLEGLLETVTEALDSTKSLLWTDATYTAWGNTYPAYVISVDVHTRKEF